MTVQVVAVLLTWALIISVFIYNFIKPISAGRGLLFGLAYLGMPLLSLLFPFAQPSALGTAILLFGGITAVITGLKVTLSSLYAVLFHGGGEADVEPEMPDPGGISIDL